MPTMSLPIGTVITCENGHRICETIGTVESHEDPKRNIVRSTSFDHFESGQYQPKPGDHDIIPLPALWRPVDCGAPNN